jgi:UDP-glucose 4-epimerase
LNNDSKRVLVTGGAGFIGSHLVDRLVAEDYCVRVIDNLSTGRLDNIRGHVASGKVDFVEGDVRDAELVGRCVEGVGVVFHLAAVTSVPFSVANPSLTFEVNVRGTLNLLTSSAKEKVDRFVFVSSCAVYGDPQYLPVDEGHPTKPISPYAESKLAGERYCLGFDKRQLCRSVVLRFFNVYGPRQGLNDYSGVITRFIERAKKGLPPIVYGDGLQTRDFVNVRDVVDAVMACVEKREALGEVFNVGSGKATSIKELANLILELSGCEAAVCFDKPRSGDILYSYADVSKAERLLGFRAKTGLRDGLLVLIEQGSVG